MPELPGFPGSSLANKDKVGNMNSSPGTNPLPRSAMDGATVTVLVPTALRRFAAHQSVLEVRASNAGEALREIGRRYPQLHSQLFAADNSLRRFINVFVNSRNIRELQQEQTALVDLDTVTILPAIAGG